MINVYVYHGINNHYKGGYWNMGKKKNETNIYKSGGYYGTISIKDFQ